MRKFYSLCMALCLSAMMVNAKTVETTLWEDTYVDGVEINSAAIATFKAGDIIRVYVTVPAGGANFKIVYKGAPDWTETKIPSMEDQWQWVNDDETYKDFALTAEDLTAFTGKNIYVYKGENSVINKVSLLSEKKEMKETTLWEDTYVDGVEINASTIATFKADDILRVYVTVPAGGANFKIVYKGAPDWTETKIPSMEDQWPWVNGGETYKEFALTAEDLTAFAGKNIYVYKGDNSVINKVSLLTEDTGGSTAVSNANANVKAAKIIRNGQVVIIRDNKEYSIFGYEL